MTIHRGKFHNYLKMKLDYTEGGTVKYRTIYYINGIIDEIYKV